MSVNRTIGPLVIESLQNFSFNNRHILTSSELDLYKDLTNDHLGRVMRKPVFLGFPTRSDTNWAVQTQKMSRDLKFWK